MRGRISKNSITIRISNSCAQEAQAERIACGDHQIVISGPGPGSDWDKIKKLMAGFDLTEDEVWVYALERFHRITDWSERLPKSGLKLRRW